MKSVIVLALLGVSGIVTGCSQNPLAPSAALASTQTVASSQPVQPAGLCGDYPCGSIPSPCKNVGCAPDAPVPCVTSTCAPPPEDLPCGPAGCTDDRRTPEAPLRRVVDLLLGR